MNHAPSTLWVLLLASITLGGCSFYNEEELAEYERVHAASRAVLARAFDVRDSQFVEGHMIAYSRISNQFGEMQRFKVDTWVDRDTEGFFVPRVQVLEQINVAIVDPGKNSRGQDGPAWRSVGHNHKLETQIQNAILDEISGHTAHVDADWFNTDLELIERQRKIDQARAEYQAREQQGGGAN